MLTKANQSQLRDIYRTMTIFDHFADGFVAGATEKWNTITTGSGASVANNDGAGGILTLTTGATQNNEAAIYTPKKLFQFNANQPQNAFCVLNYTEGAVDQAGIAFGFASSWTHILADSTFALPSSLSGALIYKKPGDTLWSCWGSVGTTQQAQQCNRPCQAAGQNQVLEVLAAMDAGGNVELTFRQGPVGAGLAGEVPMIPNVTSMARFQMAKFFIPYASAAQMQFGLFVKSGDAGGTSEVVNVDVMSAEILSIP